MKLGTYSCAQIKHTRHLQANKTFSVATGKLLGVIFNARPHIARSIVPDDISAVKTIILEPLRAGGNANTASPN